MSKARLFLILCVLSVAFSLSAMAQTPSITMMNGASTATQSAVMASFLASIDDGALASTAISVSNILGTPPGSGFPTGGDESGPVIFYLFNSIGTEYVFSTADHPDVGSGVDIEGDLGPGGTYTVNLHEILQALFPDREPGDRDFIGYAWIVGGFDAITGSYFNFFPLAEASQSFLMEPSVGGIQIKE